MYVIYVGIITATEYLLIFKILSDLLTFRYNEICHEHFVRTLHLTTTFFILDISTVVIQNC